MAAVADDLAVVVLDGDGAVVAVVGTAVPDPVHLAPHIAIVTIIASRAWFVL